ncbi:MAG: GNAT family N-acetyltransferase [Nanoarchaeota archaeon]
MKIRNYRVKDTEQIASLIKTTFLKYNGSEGGRESVEKYVDRHSRERLPELTDMLKKDDILFVAEDHGGVVGIVRGNENRVFQLFVDGKYHGQGLGRMLMERFEQIARRMGSKLINLRSSLYAVPFYEHLGYKKTTGVRTFKKRFGDIKYQPMRKELK